MRHISQHEEYGSARLAGRFFQVYQRHTDTLQFLRDVVNGELVIAGGNARSARIAKMIPPFNPFSMALQRDSTAR
jgi:hypothetical protein